jgi:hypothetical protein
MTADTFRTADGCLAYADHIWDRRKLYGRLTDEERVTIRILKRLALDMAR